jgi:hypothetical protein
MRTAMKMMVFGGTRGPAPVNTVAPVVSGFILENATLSTTNGTWDNTPTSYTYQWKSDGSSIVGATSATYTLTAGEVGTVITCAVTATNAGGDATQASNATEAILAPLLWFDPSDLSTMFQDTAGTTPVTTDGHQCQRIDDKSGNGRNGTQAGGPNYNTSGGLHWLTFVAASTDRLEFTNLAVQSEMTEISAWERAATGTLQVALGPTSPHGAAWYTDNKFYEALGGTESTATAADTATGTFVLTSRRDASNAIIRKSKVQVGTRTAAAVSGNFTRYGAFAASYSSGKNYGLVVVGACTEAQMASLETTMGTKAGLSI